MVWGGGVGWGVWGQGGHSAWDAFRGRRKREVLPPLRGKASPSSLPENGLPFRKAKKPGDFLQEGERSFPYSFTYFTKSSQTKEVEESLSSS